MNTPADTLAALAPCPFCGGATRVHSNRDWHRLTGDHDDTCVFVDTDAVMTVPATDECLIEMVAAWNRRASLKGEAVAWMVERNSDPSFPRLMRTEAEADSLISYCNVNPPVTKRPLIYGDTTPPAPQAAGEVLVDRIAYALAAHEVWGGQITPDEALKDEKMRDECYSRAELVAEMIATHPSPSPAPQGGGEAVKDWRDAQTYDDLYACGIRGFLDLDNRHKPEAEVVAAVKESLAAIERGEFEEVAFIGDDLPPLPEPYFAKDNFLPDKPDEDMYTEEQMREFARDTLNRYAKHFKPTPPAQQPGEVGEDIWRGIYKMLVAAYEHGLNSESMDMNAMKARYAALAPKEKGNG